ncbi:MAG: efflux RND transporter periplasmic adaptor subunit [Alphaproteobacteria bacterium]|nr:efflux RND transporter periplasmic adaptor subunit [Alphaproteobacteria bacterium]
MIRYSALALALLLAACSGGNQQQDPAPVALVTLGKAEQGSVDETVTLYGEVEQGAQAAYTLSAPVEATVAKIVAPAGTPVARGQLVVSLRPSPATGAELSKATSDLRAAEAAYARAKRLRADGLASDADVENARQSADSAKATHASLATRAKGLQLRAPGAGHVQSIPVKPGDLVSAGATMATITRVGAQRARFGIDPAAARKLSAGVTLSVRPEGAGKPFSAPVLSVDPAIDPNTHLASVFIDIPADRGLAAGQPLSAQVPVRQSGEATVIPYAALLDDGGQPYVFVLRNGVAHRHDVVTGASNGQRIAVLKGVSPGDAVVVQGGTAVEDGMKVRTK